MPDGNPRRLDGLLLVIFSSLWFSATTMLVKALGPGVPVALVSFMRCAVSIPFVAAMMIRTGTSFRSENAPRLILRGLWGVLAMACQFWALPRIPLANAMLMTHSSPIYAALWGVLFLDETLDRTAVACLAVAFSGVYVTLRPELDLNSLPHFVALMGGIFASLAFATIKSLTKSESPLRIVFYFTLIGTAAFLPGALKAGAAFSALQWTLMAFVGITATVGQVFLTAGIGRAPVSRASIGALLIIVINIAGGWVFWGELPDGWTAVGCVLIVGGILGLTSAVRRRLLVTVAE